MSVLELSKEDVAEGPRARTGYQDDFSAWALEQADAVRSGRYSELDVENLVEELEGLSRSEAHQLYKRYLVLTAHLLKWRHQAERRTPSWEATIVEQRVRLQKVLRENPSLKSSEAQQFSDAYAAGRARAAKETGLPLTLFPTEPPFTLEQARDPDFWPEAAGRK